ncbi:uncharacterized protein L201_006933 [Kwoniella dendrophila CBS 6074]|uniref:BRCT domain-containing protein n=1 Tax=Kwoniella dendrophila CBS 6074 TaxID=1295534 RepID=A0AAX4K3M5_9TREE
MGYKIKTNGRPSWSEYYDSTRGSCEASKNDMRDQYRDGGYRRSKSESRSRSRSRSRSPVPSSRKENRFLPTSTSPPLQPPPPTRLRPSLLLSYRPDNNDSLERRHQDQIERFRNILRPKPIFAGKTFYIHIEGGRRKYPSYGLIEMIRRHGGSLCRDPDSMNVTNIIVNLSQATTPFDVVYSIDKLFNRKIRRPSFGQWNLDNIITYLAKLSGSSHNHSNSNSKSSLLQRKVVLREEWLVECIEKGRLIEEEDYYGGWEVRGTYDPYCVNDRKRSPSPHIVYSPLRKDNSVSSSPDCSSRREQHRLSSVSPPPSPPPPPPPFEISTKLPSDPRKLLSKTSSNTNSSNTNDDVNRNNNLEISLHDSTHQQAKDSTTSTSSNSIQEELEGPELPPGFRRRTGLVYQTDIDSNHGDGKVKDEERPSTLPNGQNVETPSLVPPDDGSLDKQNVSEKSVERDIDPNLSAQTAHLEEKQKEQVGEKKDEYMERVIQVKQEIIPSEVPDVKPDLALLNSTGDGQSPKPSSAPSPTQSNISDRLLTPISMTSQFPMDRPKAELLPRSVHPVASSTKNKTNTISATKKALNPTCSSSSSSSSIPPTARQSIPRKSANPKREKKITNRTEVPKFATGKNPEKKVFNNGLSPLTFHIFDSGNSREKSFAEMLISANGGIIASATYATYNIIPLSPNEDLTDHFHIQSFIQDIEKQPGRMAVSADWIQDCIQAQRLLPLDNYTISLNNLNSHVDGEEEEGEEEESDCGDVGSDSFQ